MAWRSESGLRAATAGASFALGTRCLPAERVAVPKLVMRVQVQPHASFGYASKKRRGKPVTVLDCEGLKGSELASFIRELKAKCATGGTARDGIGELRGDHREVVRTFLTEQAIDVRG